MARWHELIGMRPLKVSTSYAGRLSGLFARVSGFALMLAGARVKKKAVMAEVARVGCLALM
jgi:hypothetical protein